MKNVNIPWRNLSRPLALFAVVFLILSTGCSGTAKRSAPTPETSAGADSVVISTRTATPPMETSTAVLEPTADANATGRIPGLTAVNVTVSLEQQQFTCTAVKKGMKYYERSCTKGVPPAYVFTVVVSGTTPFVVDFIEASVRQAENPDIDLAIPVLVSVASLPYDGSVPDEARAWVESTTPVVREDSGGTQEETFGGVKYVLYGPPTALTLEMGELP